VSHEPTVLDVREHPNPVPVPVSVGQVIAEGSDGLVVGAEAAEGRYDLAIVVHAPDLSGVLLAQAFGDQPIGPKGVYRSKSVRPRHTPATHHQGIDLPVGEPPGQ
jgi:hypothetical protein